MSDEPEKVQTLDELKAALVLAASTPGQDGEVVRLSKLVVKQKSDVEKAEANKMKAEDEALAGKREAMEKTISDAIGAVIKELDIVGLKAKGFTCIVNHAEDDKGRVDPNGAVKVKGAVKLLVPAIKAKGVGGGGNTGLLKQETGLSRHELVDQYATDAEKDTIQTAFDNADSRKDSARYNAEKPVIKRILGDNPQLIKR